VNSANAVKARPGVPIQMGNKKVIGDGITLTKFKSFTGGRIFKFKLNSGRESPFYSNSFSMHVMKGKGTPSVLNGDNVNPVLLKEVEKYLKNEKVTLSSDEKQVGLKPFLKPAEEAPGADWSAFKKETPKMSSRLYTTDDMHG